MNEPSTDVLAPSAAGASLAPPVTAQSVSHANAAKLQSEKVVVAAPTSFAGSAARIWKLVGVSDQLPVRAVLAVAAVALIGLAWVAVIGWYLFFGLLLVPYRLTRRGQRKNKRQALQHREMMAAIQGRQE